MKSIKSFVILIFVVIAAVFFGSPYYRLYQLKSAYERGDVTTVVAAIDFDMLKPNLKQQLHTRLDTMMSDSKAVRALNVLGVENDKIKNFGDRFIDTAIERAITPANVERLLRGQVDKDSEQLVVGVAVMNDMVDVGALIRDYLVTADIDTAITRQKEKVVASIQEDSSQSKPKLRYCGLNCFEVQAQIKKRPVTIILNRRGLVDWQVVDARLL